MVELASQHIMFNKGNDKKQGGVGFLIHKKLIYNILIYNIYAITEKNKITKNIVLPVTKQRVQQESLLRNLKWT